MIEKVFGKRSGFQVAGASIGGMRFPEDSDEAVVLIRQAIDSGMRYIDTSRGYGDSEIKIGKALKDGYREKVILSTKCSPWIMKVEDSDDTSADCTRRRIEDSMKRLDVDYLDFYQVWNIDSRQHYEQATCKGGMLEGIQKAISEGLVRHTGFTTHDSVDNLLSYMDEIEWCEVILVSYNMLNTTYGPVLKAAHRKGIGTIVMNPVGGGKLSEASLVLQPLVEEVGAACVADMAIRFLMSNPNIDTLISGISKPSDVDDSIASVNGGGFTRAQMQRIEEFLNEISMEQKMFCTGCKYCMPCPQGIDIPSLMSCVFDDRFWGFREVAQRRYLEIKEPRADACIQCGECEEKCTQKLKIMDEMEYCQRLFGSQA